MPNKPVRLILLFILLTIIVLPTLLVQASEPEMQTIERQFIKVSAAEMTRLNALNIKFEQAVDYGGFYWLEVNENNLKRLVDAGIGYAEQHEPFTLTLGEQRFDPLQNPAVLPQGWKAAPRSGADLHLIQFTGPTRGDWLTELQHNGLEIVQYVHPFSYIVWGDLNEMNRAQSADFIRAAIPFAPAFRVLPAYRNLDSSDYAARIMVYRGADTAAVLQSLTDLGAKIEGRASTDPVFEMINLSLPGNSFQTAAQIPGVYSLKLRPTDGGPRGEMSNQVNVNNVDGSNLAFTGYQAWLAAAGVDGSGVIMANVDGGIFDTHPDLVNRMLPCAGTTCGGAATDSHGTHTAGIMAADGSSGVVDGNGFLRGLGVAPGANLVEQVYSPFYTWSGGMLLLITESYSNSAFLSGNSWGPAGTPQGYDDDTRQVDIGVRDADSTTSGNQQFSYILSFMNGNGGTSSQGSPDEAKNIFTIGSTKMQLSNGSQDLNINDISFNSAHGPALDGRTIPHMVAPGCYVDSPDSATGYGLKCGTSMASPHVSGAAALFFEYYRKLFGVDPSPALVKAAFLPVAHDLAGFADADGGTLGHPFDSKQGWGRMDTAAVVSPTFEVQYFDAPVIFDNTGEEWTQTLYAADPAKPLRIMLVWTDAPGHGLGGNTPAWNNDLDLIVEMGGNTYYGNNFNAATGWSQSGGSPDGMNNTEGIFIGPTASGAAVVRVSAANINSDGVPGAGDATDQDFSLVCYNCARNADFTLAVTPASLEVCTPNPAIYTVNIGQVLSYTAAISLSASGHPAGSSATFAQNPVTAPTSTTLTISNTIAAAPGAYTIDVLGSGPTSTHTSAVTLNVSAAVPGSASPLAPANGATGVSLTPVYSWTAAAQASGYYLETAADNLFSNVVYSATVAGSSHPSSATLEPDTIYYWRVRASNICGDGGFSSTFSFTTLKKPPILLIDDDDNSPDARSAYTTTLDALGIGYDIWDTGNSDSNEPSAADLAPYQAAIWFTGDSFSASTGGPGAAAETELAAWLDSGGCMLMSSQDWLYAKGGSGSDNPTPLMTSHFGLSAGDSDVNHTVVTGTGTVFGGLGPYTLNYPFTNYSDDLTPDDSAALTFSGDAGVGDAAISKDSGVYKTSWLGFPFEALPNAPAREDVMDAFVSWCGIGPPASISLTKTVGLDPNLCAVDDSIVVPSGTNVSYCYLMQNTGAITLTLHNLVDDQLGTVFSGTIAVPPNVTAWISKSAVITQNTVNTAVWTAFNNGTFGTSAFATDAATVTVTQPPPTYTLSVTTTGSGTVTLNPPGGVYTENITVSLTAIPNAGWFFNGWTGSITTANNPESITMTGDKTVTATFATTPPVTYTLSVNVVGQGSVTPTGGIYISGTVVSITAAAAAGWQFNAWTGDLTGVNNPESITMDSNQVVSATFIPSGTINYGVSIAAPINAKSGSAGGAVTYTVLITNTGNTTDTFTITAGMTGTGSLGSSQLPTNTVQLAASAATSLDVIIGIPGGVSNGYTFVTTVTAVSQGNPAISDSVDLTTTAIVADKLTLYVPLFLKQ